MYLLPDGADGTRRSVETRRLSSKGSTLIEIAIACFLLTILVIALGAYLLHAQTAVNTQGDRRVALAAANSRLEALRASPYNDIKPPALSYQIHHIYSSAGVWLHALTDPGQTIFVNGRHFPIVTTVQYMDADGGTPTYDHLRVRVQADFRPNGADNVALEALYAP